MNIQLIKLNQLHPSKSNVRKVGAKDYKDLIPSLESIGLLQPLIIRQSKEQDDSFEVIAGQRRYHAMCHIAAERELEPIPCIILKDSDDATAIEASLTENIARLPMDEIDQFKAFSALKKQGLSIDDIALKFGITEKLVKQRLAIANLYSPILTAFRKVEIQASTLQTLTLAPKQKQKQWWKLFKENEYYAPQGRQLKDWLFGGQHIPTEHALFDLSDYKGAIISDLFGDQSYFDDTAQFWELQNQAIAQAKENYIEKDWQDVTLLEIGAYFNQWEHETFSRKDGGRVYVQIAQDGKVTFHEGYLTSKEAKRLENGVGSETGDANVTAQKPELTKAMQNYLDLHRHAAVRNTLRNQQGLAMRVAVAQILCSSDLWTVIADAQKASKPEIGTSLAINCHQIAFAEEREIIRSLLGYEVSEDEVLADDNQEDGDYLCNPKGKTLIRTKQGSGGICFDASEAFIKLLALDDDTVTRIFTYLVAESLPSSSSLVEILGLQMELQAKDVHQPDTVFFGLIKDKKAINAIISEVAGEKTANSVVAETAKVQKAKLETCIKAKTKNWTPRYFAFPMEAYDRKDGLDAIRKYEAYTELLAQKEPAEAAIAA